MHASTPHTTSPAPTLPAHLARGQLTRERVMAYTVGIATEEGLDALTIGRVADAVGLTKAGILGHFASKEALQIATLDAGRAAFIDAVLMPAMQGPAGMQRVIALLKVWVSHIDMQSGGCFFASVAAEFDGRSGPVKEHIAQQLREWIGTLQGLLRKAQVLGHLRSDADVNALAFQLHGFELMLNLRRQLLGDTQAKAQALQAMRAALDAAATEDGQRMLKAWQASVTRS